MLYRNLQFKKLALTDDNVVWVYLICIPCIFDAITLRKLYRNLSLSIKPSFTERYMPLTE